MGALVVILFLGLFVAGYFLLRKTRPTHKPVNGGGGGVEPNQEPKKPEEHQTT